MNDRQHRWLRHLCALWLAVATVGAAVLWVGVTVQHGGGDRIPQAVFVGLMILFVAGIVMCFRSAKLNRLSLVALVASLTVVPLMLALGVYHY